MKNDKILFASILGSLSILSSEIITLILKNFGIVIYTNIELSSLLILGNKPSNIFGLFVSPIIAGISAVLLYLIFLRIGHDHLIIKCTHAGIFLWILFETVTTIFFEGKLIPPRPPISHFGHLLGAIAFGITEGILFKKYLFDRTV